MKKLLTLVLVLCICVSFAACTATDPNNLFESTTAGIMSSTDSTEKTAEMLVDDGYYQYGNMQKNIPSGGYMLLDNQVIFSFRSRLYYYNLLSGTVTPFCNDATCTHRDNKCGTLGLSGNLEVYKGKVYALSGRSVVEYVNGGKESAALDGANAFWHNNDHLYIQTADMALIAYEEGSDSHRVVLDEFVGYWSVIFDDYLYYSYSGIHRVNLEDSDPKPELICENVDAITDGNYIYYVDWETWKLHRCNMDGSDSVVLVDQQVMPASMNFDDEYFYFRLYTDNQITDNPDCYDIYRFLKSDPAEIEKIATLPVAVYQVFTVPGTDKIFVETVPNQEEGNLIWVMDTDGSNITRVEIPEY